MIEFCFLDFLLQTVELFSDELELSDEEILRALRRKMRNFSVEYIACVKQ